MVISEETPHSRVGWLELLKISAVLVVLLPFYDKLYLSEMPNPTHKIGIDYSLFFPNLLSGYYWFLNNGISAIPWFSPSQCGGVPFFPDTNVAYYSVPQFLVFVSSPLTAVQATFWLFAVIGFYGCYFLLRVSFRSSVAAALLAAGLFMFNGFYADRILIGHLTFHAFMLMPVLCCALLPPAGTAAQRAPQTMRALVASCCLAYMFQAGMVHIIPPVLLACLILMLIHAGLFGWRVFPWLCLGSAGVISLLLSAGKLTATLALLSHFPRSDYPLPGIASLFSDITLAFQTLFLTPPENVARAVANSRWRLDRHEWEYGVSPVPLLLIAGFLMTRLAGISRPGLATVAARAGLIASIVLLLTVPIALNWYEPSWNGFLKSLPFFQNSSNLLRWFSVYIPVAIVLAALAQDRLRLPASVGGRGQATLTGLGIVALLAWNLHIDRSYYEHQSYDVRSVEGAYARAAATRQVPPISTISTFSDEAGRLGMPVARNDVMTLGDSQLDCYQPLFGYALEHFPRKSLKIGPVTSTSGEFLNVKNPACYLFPAENACEPGDQFQSSAADREQAFVNYRPFEFVEPAYARLANMVSLISLIGVLAALLWSGCRIVLAARNVVRTPR